MAELKTKCTDASVSDFIHNSVENEAKKADAFMLLDLMQAWTGYEPKMWGTSIIGFGQYHYKSERSRQEGDWPLIGFSPRKAAFSLYVYSGTELQEQLIEKLGKFSMGKGCIYVKKLSDIDTEILKKIALETVRFLQEKYGV